MSPSLARLPRSFQVLFGHLRWIFRLESFENFCWLVTGWILNPGRQTVSRALVATGGEGAGKCHSAFYRLLAGATWCIDSLGEALFQALLPHLPNELLVVLDDTLCRKSGPHLFGGGMHRDERGSNLYRSQAARRICFSFGHNFVVLALWVPFPWNPERGAAIPFLARLFRSSKTCSQRDYRKRTELAVEMIEILSEWVTYHAPQRKILVTGDAEYACKTVVRSLPDHCEFTGPVLMNAALYEPAPPRGRCANGRPRKKGARLPSPKELADDPAVPWVGVQARLYGRKVRIQIKKRILLWYTVAGSRKVLLVVTRDPRGRMEDRAFFSTQTHVSPLKVLRDFSRRWSLEVTFRDVKQHLGLEDPQNGFQRARRKRKKKAGPQARGNRGQLAITRTAPLILFTYGLTWLWYLEYGDPALDVRLARRQRPWDRKKSQPSYEDVLIATRREFALAGVSSDPLRMRVLENSKAARRGAALAA